MHTKNRMNKPFSAYSCGFLFGGDGETRTLAPVSRPTPLAGEPLHQLGYISKLIVLFYEKEISHSRQLAVRPSLPQNFLSARLKLVWRRGWDSTRALKNLPQAAFCPLRGRAVLISALFPQNFLSAKLKLVWRRGWDSNPRLLRVTGFQDQLLKPLGHLSIFRDAN